MGEHFSFDTFKLPQEWYEEGEGYFREGKFKEARQAFEKAIELDPFYPQALCGLSRIFWQDGEYREAAEQIYKALEIDPNDPDVIRQCAELFMAVGQKGDAFEIVKSYLERNPWDTGTKGFLMQLGETLNQGSHLQINIREPESQGPADFLTREGEAQFEKGHIDRARMCFEMALEHNPNHPMAHNNLGVIFWNSGELNRALEHFQQAFSNMPEDKDIVFNSFHALVEAGHLDVAKDLIKLHIQKDPFNEEAWKLYDEVVFATDELKIHWDPEKLSEDVAEVYADTAKKLIEKEDIYGAAEVLHRALRINPNHLESIKMLAHVHRELGHIEEALTCYQRACERDSQDESTVIEYAEYLISMKCNHDAGKILEEFLGRKVSEKAEKLLEHIKEEF